MQYDQWQQDVLDATGNVLLNKGRQIGGTEIFAHKAAEFIINNPNEQIICVSDTLEQAENIIIMVLTYLQEHHPTKILKGKHKPTKGRVWVKGNGHIRSRPVGETGDAVRSFTGKILYVDEASKMPRAFWTAAKAIKFTRAGSAIWMSSTPRGKFDDKRKPTYYYKAWLNVRKRYNVIEMDSEWVAHNRVVCDTWTQAQKDNAIQHLIDEKADMSEAEYGQEYLHKFYDDLCQWFPDDLIRKCMVAKRPQHIDEDWHVGQGNDIARKGEDAGSYEVFRQAGKRLIQLENQTSHDQPITTTAKWILELDRKFHGDYIFIDDEGSLGKGVYDILMDNEDDDIKAKVKGISNSTRILDENEKEKGIKKTELYVKLLSMMEKGEIDLLDDEDLFQSFKSVQFQYTNNTIGERILRIFGNDTHICEGVTRATELLKYEHLNLNIYSIKVC